MTDKEQAEKWANGIAERLGRERFWNTYHKVRNMTHFKKDSAPFFYFFCGYLLGPPGCILCTSQEPFNPLPMTQMTDLEEAARCYRLGVQQRIGEL